MSKSKILVVEDDAGLREALIDTLEISGYICVAAPDAERAIMLLKQQTVDLVISDVQMGEISGLSLLRTIKAHYPSLPVLMMTAFTSIEDAVQAMREGAIDYLSKPFAPEVLLNLVGRYVPANKVESHQPIVADVKSLQLLKLAEKVARADANVMVLGPSGSGKEVLSKYIHDHSKVADGPFIAINCAAIPDNMLEATLFGYEKGAFTGAVQACPGKFEQAQNGTILLDEVTEMTLGLQVKLLRVLQEREVERLGGRKTIKLNVRVIATSNRDLKEAVANGKFREDLYYRLNVFPLTWPALAERANDVIPLATHLIDRHYCSTGGYGADRADSAIPQLTMAAKVKLQSYGWPGNVRELDNVIQRALIVKSGDIIDSDDILLESDSVAPLAMSQQPIMPDGSGVLDESHQCSEIRDEQLNSCFKSELKSQEHKMILDTLNACGGSRKVVSETLGISPRTLRYKIAKMRENGIEIPA
ncbi:MAG: two-component system response regulator FlrC [Phenylobacterium sp.]|jgi:two-component system response regulator FlrC